MCSYTTLQFVFNSFFVANINVPQGSDSGIFDIRLTANLPRNLSERDLTCASQLWPFVKILRHALV